MTGTFKLHSQRFRTLIYHPILLRWLDLAFLTLVSVFVVTFLRPEIRGLSEVFLRRSAPWTDATTFLFFAILSWFVSFLLIRLGALKTGHFRFRRFFGFPPVWISALMGSLVVIANQDHRFYESFKAPMGILLPWLGGWLVPPVAGLLVALVAHGRHPGNPCRETSATANAVSGSAEEILRNRELLSWLEEERPIETPLEDRFGFSIIASRIASILRGEKIRTVGIIGPYGTGKTSLLNLTEFYLQERQHRLPSTAFSGDVILCRVHGWGRIKGSIAERVLTIALEQLSEEIDCSSIISLPASYRRAIGGLRWPGGPVLEALLETSHDPVSQLSKLDHILMAAGLRLVIFLEDLDRNTADEIIRDEIPSLLDRLRGMRNISFVLAIGTEHQYSAILIRICDFIEAIA